MNDLITYRKVHIIKYSSNLSCLNYLIEVPRTILTILKYNFFCSYKFR